MPQAVATRYARALADSVLDPKNQIDPQGALAELRSFSGMLAESPELKNVLLSPAVTPARKRAVLDRFAQSVPFSRIVRNFFFVLVDHRRIDLVDEITEAFASVLDERMGVVQADVRSATPLSDGRQQELQVELSRLAGKQVRGAFSVDSSLIGGVVARIGSTVYDGSVRTQLESLRERLTGRQA